MATQRLQFTEWLPDQPSMAGSLNDAKNVVPLSLGYAPFNNAVDYSDNASENLNQIFVGKFGADVQVFGGGATKLFKLDNTDLTMDDVSKAGGYTSTDNWQFRQFGKIVLAANNVAKIQAWEIGSSSVFADVAAAAPIAKYITVVRDFVVAGNLDTGTNANKIQWSDINDETNWTSGSTSQSDYQIIADGGNITGLAGGEFGLVFLEKAIVRMSYIGSPLFFQFDTISRGLGTTVTGIGTEKVDRWFFDDCSLTDIGSMTTAIDPVKKLVVWNYKAVDGTRHMIVFNWQINKWSRITTDATVVGTVASTGTTLEGFETAYLTVGGSFVIGKEYQIYGIGTTDFTLIGATTNLVGEKFTATGVGSGSGSATDLAAATAGGATLETLSASLDSRLWIGGKFLFAGAKDAKIITFTGSTYNSEIITTDVEVGYNSLVQLARPTIDNGSANVKVASRKELDDNVLFGSSVSTSSEGRASLRSHGRYHRFSIVPTGNWTNAVGIDVDITPTGTR
jgi:hypothetical protein